MKLFLAKPDLTYFGQYNEMMAEWCESGTQIAPWFLDAPFPDMEAFAVVDVIRIVAFHVNIGGGHLHTVERTPDG